MALSGLDVVASRFQSDSEEIHEEFLRMRSDTACAGCDSAGLGEAILTAWLQNKWGEFTEDLLLESVLGMLPTMGNPAPAAGGLKTRAAAKRILKSAGACVIENQRLKGPVWHAPWFAIEASTLIGLRNLTQLQAALIPTVTPKRISDFRNYLVHPNATTRSNYQKLQEKLGMLRVETKDLLHQELKPGLPVFTAWVRELQGIAQDATR